ncbi:hypothetical protein [Streptomyces luteogriseus]|uniref:hypothetical protein n=1 Tax=Streptomyces luteogriseus TaxID=68233 RepID=UPI0036AD860E
MAADQLPAEVGEFATYLDGLLARLDPSGGWCAVFWQRDPEGMRACLDGREVPPWDVVEALLQDLAGQYGPGGAGPEAERARVLHAAALAAYDTRPGGRDALGDRLDVMLREQKYAAERQAALARHLTSATTREQADALRLDLAWARDDHERARARCAELRARMAHLDRREQEAPAVWGDADGPGWQARQVRAGRSGPGEAGAGATSEAFNDPAGSDVGWQAQRHSANRSGSGEAGGVAASEAFGDSAGGEVGWQAQQVRAGRSGPGEAGAGATSEAFNDPAGTDVGWQAQRHSANRSGSGEAGGAAASEAFGDSAGGEVGWQAQQVRAGRSGPQEAADGATPGAFPDPAGAGSGQHTPQRPVGRSMPGEVVADGTLGVLGAPAPEPPAPKARRRRRGSARFAGMDEEEAAPVVVLPAVVPTLPAPAPAATGRTPRGARFAGAAEEAVVEPPAREGGAVGTTDLAEVGRTVDLLARLRGEGRSGEAHALLAEVASWEPGRFPLLAERLRSAGLEADWQTLLWEAASLPAGRLVAAADALVAAGWAGDGRQMLRQGVARPPGEVGEAVLGLTAERRHREVRVLLDAYVRARTPEEAARSAEPDPQRLVPLLLEAAQGVSDERRWDLVHALRVAGFAA